MHGVPVEICIDCASPASTRSAVEAAYRGGAARVELCAAMDRGGLTPAPEHVRLARAAFGDRPGLLVMIRPRDAGFAYTPSELTDMKAAIRRARDAGADGLVLGALQAHDGRIDAEAVAGFLSVAGGLPVTFHRGFDAVPDRHDAIETLVALGVARVLTAGMAWGRPGTALDGAAALTRTIEDARGRLEVVIAGGIAPGNVHHVLERLPPGARRVSVHAFSGVRSNGATTEAAVRALVRAAGG